MDEDIIKELDEEYDAFRKHASIVFKRHNELKDTTQFSADDITKLYINLYQQKQLANINTQQVILTGALAIVAVLQLWYYLKGGSATEILINKLITFAIIAFIFILCATIGNNIMNKIKILIFKKHI